MSAPKLVESIPAVTAPVRLPRIAPRRGRFLAGVITGAALLVLDVAGIAFYFVSGVAS